MDKLIKMILAACNYGGVWNPEDLTRSAGLKEAANILQKAGGLWLEEITEEEARKENEVVGRWDAIGISEMFDPNYQVVTYDPDAEGWGVEWIDCIGQSQAVMYATPSKFYRIPK